MALPSLLLFTVLVVLAVCIEASASDRTISVRGHGYLEYPLVSVEKRTDLEASFSTGKVNGFLVLAEGLKEYLLVEITDSKVLVRLKLGNRTQQIQTKDGKSYSDKKWHHVKVQRINAKLKFFVDGDLVNVIRDPSSIAGMLEIRAVHVGGVDNFREPGMMEKIQGRYFQGCIANVTFNGKRILEPPRRSEDRKMQVKTKDLDWGKCDEKVFSNVNLQTVSFIPPFAYMKLLRWEARFSGTIEFEFQTSQADEFLLFNGGRSNWTDFVGLELVGGRMRLAVNHGSGNEVELLVGQKLNNRKWHLVHIDLQGRHVQLMVDHWKLNRKLKGKSRHLDIAGPLFVGGIKDVEAEKAWIRSMSNVGGEIRSFSGCIRGMSINHVDVNFGAAKTSRGVSSGCAFTFPCQSNPCRAKEVCVDWTDVITHQCVCKASAGCDSHEVVSGSGTPSEAPPVTLAMSPIEVREGSRVILATKYFVIHRSGSSEEEVKDYVEMHSGDIEFSVERKPSFGHLVHDLQRDDILTHFTYTDVMSNYISYWHDGSEEAEDSMLIRFRLFNVTGLQLVEFNVLPDNDRPQLVHPKSNERFSLAAGSCKIINPGDLLFTDNDNDDNELTIEILNPNRLEGQMELVASPWKQITIFTQKQISQKEVCFRHIKKAGHSVFTVILRVTDGLESVISRFGVHAIKYPIQLDVGVLSVAQGSSVTLSPSAIQVSADWRQSQEPEVSLMGRLIEFPESGWIEIGNQSKVTVQSNFSYEELTANTVAYVHNSDSFSPWDSFKIQFWAGLSHSDVKAVHVDVDVGLIRIEMRKLTVQEGQTAVLDFQHLNISVDPTLKSDLLLMVLIKVPVLHGRLQNGEGNFTVESLKSGQIVYQHDDSETLSDFFIFQVKAEGSLLPKYEAERQTRLLTFPIVILPVNDEVPKIEVSTKLRLLEGSSRQITDQDLKVSDGDTPPDHLNFIITEGAGNGYLSLQRNPTESILRFTQNDIDAGRLFFTHSRDKALAGGFSFTVNDGVHQIGEEVFGIVADPLQLRLVNGPDSRLLVDAQKGPSVQLKSSHILALTNDQSQDSDVRFDLIRLPTYGQLIDQKDGTVTSFSPADIDSGDIAYTLSDPNSIVFSDLLHVNASIGHSWASFNITVEITPKPRPYISINKGLDVPEGQEVVLPSNRLQALDALKSDPAELLFTVQQSPQFGRLVQRGRDRIDVAAFTQADVNQRRIAYVHTDKNHFLDKMVVSVSNGFMNVTGIDFLFVIYSTDVKVTIRGLKVKEEGQKPLTTDSINVETFQVQLKFHIGNGPYHGKLIQRSNIDSAVKAFSLKQLENGEISYKHDGSESVSDSFEFNITLRGQTKFSGLFNISVSLIDDNFPRRIATKGLTVVENATVSITRDVLFFADADINDDDNKIGYEVWGRSRSFLVRKGDRRTRVTSFIQQDILDGTIFYQNVHFPRSPQQDRILLWVGPQKTFTVVNVQIIPLTLKQYDPTGPVEVMEGGRISLKLNVSVNIVHNSSDIRYTVKETPKSGSLVVNNVPVDTFSQEDINDNKVEYIHNGSDVNNDKILLAVKYRSKSHDIEVSVVVLPVDDTPPEILTSETLFVDRQGNATITDNILRATDTEQDESHLVFTASRPLRRGMLIRWNASYSEVTTSFSQADVNARRILYVHQEDSSRQETVRFQVSDGINTSPVSLSIQIIPRRIPIDTEALVVSEGGSGKITDTNLYSKKPEFRHIDLEFTVIRGPSHGSLQLSRPRQDAISSEGVPSMVFTTADLKSRSLTYENDGEEFLNDSFVVICSYKGKKGDNVTFLITIRPVNDEKPVLTINKGLTIWAGDVKPISTHELSANDNDTKAVDIVFRLIGAPANGYLTLKGNESKLIRSFSQFNLERGDVLFHHMGVMRDAFQFQVSDGNNSIEDLFNIDAIPLNLTVTVNTGLAAPIGKITVIWPANLTVETNDEGSRRTILIQTTNPILLYGRLINASNPTQLLYNFTMRDVEMGLVGYQYTDQVSLPSDDYFTFNASVRLGEPIMNVRFSIQILLKQTLGSALASNNILTMNEGDIKLISRDHLDAVNIRASLPPHVELEITYNITVFPTNGVLMRKSSPGQTVTYFTQREIDNNLIEYKHDDSETNSDWFQFSLTVHNQSWTTESIVEIFNISVHLVNDQPPKLVFLERAAILVQGMSRILTSRGLNAIDDDTKPEEITYLLIQAPFHISFTYVDEPDKILNRFTQADVDNGRILMTHDGTNIFHDTAFLRAFDGQHMSPTGQWIFFVEKLAVSLAGSGRGFLGQGKTEAVLSSEQIKAMTNGNEEELLFVLTRQPRHGRLLLNGSLALNFTQKDVDDGQLTYVQTDFSAFQDSFQFDILHGRSVFANFSLPIRVVPLVSVGRLDVYKRDEPTLISTDVLDASSLYNLTGSIPLLTLVQTPVYGELMMGTTRRITVISQNQLQRREVFYEPFDDLNATNVSYVDDLVFDLSSRGVQPARLHLQVVIHPSQVLNAGTSVPSSPPFVENVSTTAFANFSTTDYPSTSRGGFTDFNVTSSQLPTSGLGSGSGSGFDDTALKDDSWGVQTTAIVIIAVVTVITLCVVGFLVWHKNRKNKGATDTEADVAANQNGRGVVVSTSVEFSPWTSGSKRKNNDPGVMTTDSEGGSDLDDEVDDNEKDHKEGETEGGEGEETDMSSCAQVQAPKLRKSEYWV